MLVDIIALTAIHEYKKNGNNPFNYTTITKYTYDGVFRQKFSILLYNVDLFKNFKKLNQ